MPEMPWLDPQPVQQASRVYERIRRAREVALSAELGLDKTSQVALLFTLDDLITKLAHIEWEIEQTRNHLPYG